MNVEGFGMVERFFDVFVVVRLLKKIEKLLDFEESVVKNVFEFLLKLILFFNRLFKEIFVLLRIEDLVVFLKIVEVNVVLKVLGFELLIFVSDRVLYVNLIIILFEFMVEL